MTNQIATQTNIDDLITQGPYVSAPGDLMATVALADVLSSTAEEVAALSEDEREEQAHEWVHERRADEDLLEIEWEIADERFTHARAVEHFEIDEVEVASVGDDDVDVDVELHETYGGYHQRLLAEATALGRDDILAQLRAIAAEREALRRQVWDSPTEYAQRVLDRALELHRRAIQAIPAEHDYEAWHEAMSGAATRIATDVAAEHETIESGRSLSIWLRRPAGMWKVGLLPVVAEIEGQLFPEGTPQAAYQAHSA